MGIIGGPQNLVWPEILRQIRQTPFDGLERNPALPPEILAGPHAQRGVIENPSICEVAVHPIKPRRNPASTRLEKSKSHFRKTFADPTPDHAQASQHHLHRVRNDMLGPPSLKALDARRWHAPGPFMNANSKVEVLRLGPERVVGGMAEHAIVIGIGTQETAAHAQLVTGIAH